jgi:nifR3 family TIM-barrel protein
MVGDWGAHHVDLNMGCPVAKVTRAGGGAALPVRIDAFAAVVRAAVRAAGDVPVTVKMRMGVDARTLTFRDAGAAAQAEGVAAVTLHARTAEQLYSGVAAWDAIAELKGSLDVPVLGNGDVWVAGDALRMMAETGCDGVVVGRGCLGRPWLFRDLSDAFAGRPVQPPPALGAVAEAMRRHVALLAEAKGEENGVREFRRHPRWYLTGYDVPDAAHAALRRAETLADVEATLATLDPSLPMEPGADARPRGVVDGPRRVTLPERWLEGDWVPYEVAASGG